MLAINKLKNILVILLLFFAWSQNSFAMNSWNFKVFYGDKEIGEHSFFLQKEGDKRKILIAADFKIDILFINVYSYKHRNTEIWEGSCLSTIESITDDNGEAFITNGKYENGVFKINSKQGTNEVVGCVSTFAYWDKSFLDNEVLLNSQTGEIVDVDISFVADEKILIRDKVVNAKRYKLKSDKLNIDLWYSDENQWLALNSITKDGTNLRYQMK
jgi:hypothetical protein